ncbi:magnesium transporter [Candidatus Woesebacteria bacterium]|nr:magnesium transporter [Candidatus Woesebacteria bacterium]
MSQLRQIDKLIAAGEFRKIKYFLLKQDFHRIAEVINHISEHKRMIFSVLPPEIQSEVILQLSDQSKNVIIPKLSIYECARFLHFNDEDDATDIIQYLPTPKRDKVLEKIQGPKRKKIEKLLTFGRETAGGIMDLDYILVKESFTFKDIAEKVQAHIDSENKVPFIILTKETGEVIGFIPHKNLIFNPPTTEVLRLSQKLPLIKHTEDQEKILGKASRLNTDVIGVVDEEGSILGIIHLRDLLRVAQAEATEDIYKFAGVRHEEAPEDSIFFKVSRRYKWLIINLATAFLAASVVSIFEGTIERLAILAVFMPIVAGEGGNAATQALAVVVRGIATHEISWADARGIIFKESVAGLLNGVIIGIITAVVATFFHAPPLLGLVLGIAMVVNLFVAGLFGALVPFILKSLNIDPAIASSIFVTTATDIIGFFVFLGLATMLLM